MLSMTHNNIITLDIIKGLIVGKRNTTYKQWSTLFIIYVRVYLLGQSYL